MDRTTFDWVSLSKDEKADLVRPLAAEHKSAGQIASILGISRNAVVGVVHRNRTTIKLHGNPSSGATALRARRKGMRPSTVGTKQARLGPPKSATRESWAAIERIERDKVWVPLPGTTPADLMSRKGCNWPVTVDGKTLFCNCQIADDKLPYCADHLRRYQKE